MRLTLTFEQRLALAGHYTMLNHWAAPDADTILALEDAIHELMLDGIVGRDGKPLLETGEPVDVDVSEHVAKLVFQTFPPANTPAVLGPAKAKLLRAIKKQLTSST